MRLLFSIAIIAATLYVGAAVMYPERVSDPVEAPSQTVDRPDGSLTVEPAPAVVETRPAVVTVVPARPRPTTAQPSENVLYRWRSASGSVVLSTEAPPTGVSPEIFAFSAEPVAKRRTPIEGLPTPEPSPALDWLPESMDELLEQVGETLQQLQRREEFFDELKKDL
ncbi:MAG: hypothetical protein AAF493_25370 [Pseudomonadota bacterium]